MEQSLKTVVLSATVLSIDKQAKTILSRGSLIEGYVTCAQKANTIVISLISNNLSIINLFIMSVSSYNKQHLL